MPSKTIVDFANQIKDYMRSAEVVEGKNLFSGIIESGAIDQNGLNTPNTTRVRGKDYYEVDEDTDYIISLTNNVSGKSLKYIVKYYAVADYSTHAIGSSNWITDFTQPISLIQNTKYIRFIFSFTDNSEMTPTNVSDPMLCTQAEWTRSHTYEPYYVPVKDSKMSWKDQGMLGAINYLQRSYNGGTTQDVTYAINADEELTATWSSTPTGSAIITYMSARKLNIKAGKRYKVTGCPSGGGWSTTNKKYRIYLYDSTNSAEVAVDTGDGAEFIATNTEYAFFVEIGTDAGASGSLTFKPMISLADANLSYDDFQPYAMTNRELTDAVTDIDTRLSVGTIVANSSLNNYYKTGDYYSNTGSNTATLSDKPSDLADAFRLSVICANFPVGQGNNATTSPITQKIELINGATPCIYMRHKTGGESTWGSWYKFTGTEVQ